MVSGRETPKEDEKMFMFAMLSGLFFSSVSCEAGLTIQYAECEWKGSEVPKTLMTEMAPDRTWFQCMGSVPVKAVVFCGKGGK